MAYVKPAVIRDKQHYVRSENTLSIFSEDKLIVQITKNIYFR